MLDEHGKDGCGLVNPRRQINAKAIILVMPDFTAGFIDGVLQE